MIVALIALFVAADGPAFAVHQISGRLLKDRSVSGTKLKNRSVSGTKLKPRSVPGSRLKLDTVTGNVVDESTFGQVPSAALAADATHAGNADKLAGLDVGQLVNGGSSFHGTCDPDDTDTSIAPCRTVGIPQPTVSNVFVIANGEWFGDAGATGTCSLHTGTSFASGLATQVSLGQQTAVHTTEGTGSGFSLAYVFDDVPAGSAVFSLFCKEDAAPNIQFANVKMSAVRLTGKKP